MSMRIQTAAVARFTCLGDKCEDTCCKSWGMQLTRETIAKYEVEAPALLDAVASGEAEYVMKRDPVTDYCVKFDQGWCSIHRDYGADFLGDACYFFPRITRSVGETVVMTAALSCPESARLMLMEEGTLAFTPREALRVPYSLKQYLPKDMAEADALVLHEQFIREAGNPEFSAEQNMMRLSAVVQALAVQPIAQWAEAANFYFKIAAGRIPPAEAAATDPYNLTHALHGLIGASKGHNRPRLLATLETIMDVIGIHFDGSVAMLNADAPQRFLTMQHHWKTVDAAMQPVLRRYLQAQMSIACFPFGGLGSTLPERISIIGVRFATVKLALMAEAKRAGGVPAPDIIIRAVQSLSRFLDHLADPTLSLNIYTEAGWMREPRLRALIAF